MFDPKKYKPKSIDDLVISDPAIRQRLEDYANGDRAGHMIMHGPPGTGKSAAASIIQSECENRRGDSIFGFDGFAEFEGATMTEKEIKGLPGTWSWRKMCGMSPPTVVINELDKLSAPMLEKLKATMDQHKGDGRIIATTNNIDKVPRALQDRFDIIEMPAVTPNDIADRVRQILEVEGISISQAQLEAVLASTQGSVRDMLSVIEDIVLKERRAPKH